MPNEILGIVISLRPNTDNISVWNKNGKDTEVVNKIKADIEKFIKIDEGVSIEYEVFE